MPNFATPADFRRWNDAAASMTDDALRYSAADAENAAAAAEEMGADEKAGRYQDEALTYRGVLRRRIEMERRLQVVAQERLQVETLETRNSDSLDFHQVAVWQLVNAASAMAGRTLSAGDLEELAQKHLAVKTLARRCSDELDFPECHVSQLRDFLVACAAL